MILPCQSEIECITFGNLCMVEQEKKKICAFSNKGGRSKSRHNDRCLCDLNVGISFCLTNIRAVLSHSFHDQLDQCLLVCLIRQEVLLYPNRFCHLGYVHLVCIPLLTSLLMSTVLYTWTNLITIKNDSRSAIVFDSE